jgi:hypothetical protein
MQVILIPSPRLVVFPMKLDAVWEAEECPSCPRVIRVRCRGPTDSRCIVVNYYVLPK